MKKLFLVLVNTIILLGFAASVLAISLSEFDGQTVNNYTLSEGILDLNGQTMYVDGDFLHAGGTLNLGNGQLVISGNYHITSADGGTCSAILKMMNENGRITVYGDFIIDTNNDNENGYNYLTAGTLEVKGDFTQKSTTYSYDYTSHNFSTAGTHTVILSGTGEQIVSFEDPTCSYFTNLNVTNQSGLVNFEELPIQGNLQSDLISDYDINLYNFNLTLNGHTIDAPNLILKSGGTIVLGNNVEIDANLLQYAGTINLTGNVEITGNYHIISADGVTCSAILKMKDINGHMIVYGDFVTDTDNYNEYGYNYLTAGALELKGDFSQKSTSYSFNYTSYNFSTTGTHTVILSGTGEQIISFEDPTNSNFNILINNNTDGVVFATNYSYNQLQTTYPFYFPTAKYIKETNKINANVTLNENLQSLNGIVAISLYDENEKLIECRIKELSELETQTFNGINNYDGNYIVKAFYWQNLTSITPLYPSIQRELTTR